MKKITLSFQLLGAIVAVTILQACAGTTCAVPKPTLTPPQSHNGPDRVKVLITTDTGDQLIFWIVGDHNAIQTTHPSVIVWVKPSLGGTKLKATAKKGGVYSSEAVGTYYCQPVPESAKALAKREETSPAVSTVEATK
jgi:hypothetical protein